VFRIKEEDSQLTIIEKFSTVIELKVKVRRVDGFDPDVVNVTALSPTRIRIQALKTGVTTVVLEDEDSRIWSVEVFTVGDVRHLQAHIRRLFPKASVEAVEVGDAVVLRGWVTHPEHITELVEVAQQFYPEVLNQIKVGGVQQVQLHVRVMEIQRTKVRRLGMNFLFANNSGYLASTVGSLTPIESLSASAGSLPSLAVSSNALADPAIAFGLINTSSVFQGFVEALKQEGLLKIMAQPSITTTNGRPASLLNGGEFPILVPAGLGTVGVEFREFGVRMEVVPIILGGGRLRLELQPEVSERDFANAISVQGVTVPGLTVRRANTQVEMGFGQTLMIAGLIARRHTAETDKLPLFGELPWIGAAFSRKRFEEVETELVILVTPEFVAPLKRADVPAGGPGAFTTVPVDRELFFNQMIEVPNYGEPQLGDLTRPSSKPGTPAAAGYDNPQPIRQQQPQLPPAPMTGATNRRGGPTSTPRQAFSNPPRQTTAIRSVARNVPAESHRAPLSFVRPAPPTRPNLRLQRPKRLANDRPELTRTGDARRPDRPLRPSLIAPKPNAN
jgi:pilus assembly protein CpaC